MKMTEKIIEEAPDNDEAASVVLVGRLEVISRREG